MPKIRAKFQCQSETRHAYNDEARTFRFQAMYDPSLPEDQRFAKATPTGHLEILVDNPAAQYEVGAFYYLDFTKVS
ncbi:MAG TPA: hypothetical protein VHV49_14225 [Pseudonocardiaceae bacterium]|nr:hypothetical protein [Pseudonocardiaceae bacterium]